MIPKTARFGYAGSLSAPWHRRGVQALEWASLAKPRLLWRLRRLIQHPSPNGLDLAGDALSALCIPVRAIGTEHVPSHGPVVAMATHPTGLLDGAAVLTGLMERRRDVRVLARVPGATLPRVAEVIVPVPYPHDPDRRAAFRAMRRAAHAHLRQGGVLVIFPAGRIAAEREGRWSEFAPRLARATGALIVPVCIDAAPTRLYRAAARAHPVLRQGVLLHEILRRADRPMRLRVGQPVPASANAATVRDIALSLGTGRQVDG